MSIDIPDWTMIIGALVLTGAIAAYLRDTSKSTFPIILALAGTFMCAAQTMKASIAGVGDVAFERSVFQASDANSATLIAQSKAIAAIGEDLGALRGAFLAYQKEANERLAATAAAPITVPEATALAQPPVELNASLAEVQRSNDTLLRANNELKRVTKNRF